MKSISWKIRYHLSSFIKLLNLCTSSCFFVFKLKEIVAPDVHEASFEPIHNDKTPNRTKAFNHLILTFVVLGLSPAIEISLSVLNKYFLFYFHHFGSFNGSDVN